MPDSARARRLEVSRRGGAEEIRILVAGLSWPPETFLARLLRGLLDRGVGITVAAAEKPSPAWRSLPGFRFARAPSWNTPRALRLWNFLWIAAAAALRSPRDFLFVLRRARERRTLPAALRAAFRFLPFAGRRFSAIYFPWNSGAISHLPLYSLAPVVVSCRGSQIYVAPGDPSRTEIREGLRASFERAAAVHCVSASILREACRYGLPAHKARVIRPAVDTDFFRPAERRAAAASESFRIVCTGALVWVKGHEYALMAIAQLAAAGLPVRFDVIGTGPDEQRARYTAHDLGIESRTRFCGRLEPAGVRERLQEADVFLLSSLSEGISNAALEGMACGLPVVASDCGGIREVVTPGVEGFLVPVRDPRAAAEALEALFRDPEARARMGKAARERVERSFRLEQQIDGFLALFQEVVQGETVTSDEFALSHRAVRPGIPEAF